MGVPRTGGACPCTVETPYSLPFEPRPSAGPSSSLERPTAMANSRFKNGGPTRGRKRVKRIGMNSGKILKLGRQKKPRRGRDYTRL